MAGKDNKAAAAPDVAELLYRQFRLAENARFLRRMPVFSSDDEMPSQLSELVRRLERTERRAPR